MTFLIVANLTLFSVAVLVGVLQKAHERYAGRPHAPWGSDSRTDADLQRVLHDLDARS
jgi:hypothetical protein